MTQKEQSYELYRDLILTLLGLGIAFWFLRKDWLLVIAACFILLGLGSNLLRKINHAFWKTVTKIMQWTVQPVIGCLIFYVILTPIGLLFQVFRKNKKAESTTFIDVDTEFDQAFFEKQW